MVKLKLNFIVIFPIVFFGLSLPEEGGELRQSSLTHFWPGLFIHILLEGSPTRNNKVISERIWRERLLRAILHWAGGGRGAGWHNGEGVERGYLGVVGAR